MFLRARASEQSARSPQGADIRRRQLESSLLLNVPGDSLVPSASSVRGDVEPVGSHEKVRKSPLFSLFKQRPHSPPSKVTFVKLYLSTN